MYASTLPRSNWLRRASIRLAWYRHMPASSSSSSMIIVRPLSRITTMGGVHTARLRARDGAASGMRWWYPRRRSTQASGRETYWPRLDKTSSSAFATALKVYSNELFLFQLTNDLCRSFTKIVIILLLSKAVFIKRTLLFQYFVLKIEPP